MLKTKNVGRKVTVGSEKNQSGDLKTLRQLSEEIKQKRDEVF
jgi:hypothetical protein